MRGRVPSGAAARVSGAATRGRRALALTADHVARATRPIPAHEDEPAFTAATDADFGSVVEALMAERPPGPLQVFAYGSLIWNPTFDPVARRRAVANGWHRQFSLETRGHRGTPETPGLMLALMPGGRCAGLALEVASGAEEATLDGLVRREIPFVETLAARRWLRLASADGPLTALAFWAGPRGDYIRPGLPLPVAAAQMARASGPNGSTAEYLRNTVEALEATGIHDRNLWSLQRLVAEEIDRF